MQSDLQLPADAETVPIDTTELLAGQPGEIGTATADPRHGFSSQLSYIALGLAAGFGIVEWVAISQATGGNATAASIIAQTLIVVTAVPFALGLIGAIRGPHRMWGIAAMLVSLVANPFILTSVLTFFGDHG